MASGFDRLERFFTSKRKASAISNETSTAPSTAPSSPIDPLDELHFPSPSFIRPKNTRMAAREEVRIRRPASGSPSTDDSSWPRKASADSGCIELPLPLRLPSLDLDTAGHFAPMFQGFSFPKPPSTDSASRSSEDSESIPFPEFLEERSSWPISPWTRLDTPPSSDPEDASLPKYKSKPKLSIVPPQAPLTPDSSPSTGPLPDWHLKDDTTVDILDGSLCEDIQRQLEQPAKRESLASIRQFNTGIIAEPPSPHSSASGSSLEEPDVFEFFSLSDDNVAEGRLDDCDMSEMLRLVETPVTVAPSISSLPFRDAPLLTLEPPNASRTAAIAAFEAARIATRYNFEMLYVVNLWPENDNNRDRDSAVALPPSSHDMTGRLLAAFGLHNGPSPFQISSDVHVKILQSEGWLEYRDEQAGVGSFGRAYACTFYPGQLHDRRSSESTSSTTQLLEATAIDRGIVFAGYRMPNPDGSMPCMSVEELAYLRRDVEALVEMLIDIHVTVQLGLPLAQAQYAEESGSVPN